MPEKQGPNTPCKCGSNKKYKKCCGAPKGVQPEVPLTPEEIAAYEKQRAARGSRMMALFAPFAMFGMPDIGQILKSDEQRASEQFIKDKMKED